MKLSISFVQHPLKEIAIRDPGALFRQLSSGPGPLNRAEARKQLAITAYIRHKAMFGKDAK